MTALVFHGLGAFVVSLNATAVTAFPTDKIRALFAYLALESGQSHRRDALAGLLWPEMDQTAALTNLRLALHRLRETLDRVEPAVSATLIQSNRQTIQLMPTFVTSDVQRFQALLTACATHVHVRLQQCSDCCVRLVEAVALYGGELLAGFGLADAPAFDEWLLLRRETLHQQALAALHTLVQFYEQAGDDEQAQRYATRQLTLDPSREEAHRQLMRSLARRGHYSEALVQYEICRRLLREQLAVEPGLETVALVEQIRAGQLDRVTSRLASSAELWQGDKVTNGKVTEWAPSVRAVTPSPHHQVTKSPSNDWSEVPVVGKLYGRETELAELLQWLGRDRCRIVALLGIGGVGKTTLAAATVKAAADHFDRVLWRSLVNAPPLDELLSDMLQRLAEQRLPDMPSTLEGQIGLLLTYLRRHRILLVLDNLESILDSAQPGHTRTGYAGYAHLIQTIAERNHQSTLLLTSRERPQGLARREEDSPLVRSLLLTGLDAAAGQAMLTARGLLGASADATALVERYSGNPLALKLVAQTVHELFGGDISAFLVTETPIFDDIRTVLEQQFARLSALEQEFLLWLAIEREPVTMQQLRDNLVQSGPPRVLIEALRALQRRSLVNQSPQGFLLQNVITEYLTEWLVEQVGQEILDFRFWILDSAVNESQSKIQNLKSKILNRHALLKATAKEYVRASQRRLLVQPLAAQLQARLGPARVMAPVQPILTALRAQPSVPGYAAGNLLNLLLHLGVDLRGYDFASLHVWHADLSGSALPAVNFTGADLRHARFSHSFGEILAIQFVVEEQLLIASFIQGQLCLWRVQEAPAAGQLLQEAQRLGAAASMARFSPDGRFLVSDHVDCRLRLWVVATGQLLHTLVGHSEMPSAFAFTRDGALLASSDAGGMVHLWDVTTGAHHQTLSGPARPIPALAFAPPQAQGQLLAAGDVDGGIYLWRVGDDAPFQRLHGHTEEAHALAFSADGALLVSGSHDRTIQVWEVASGQRRYTLHTHMHAIRVLAISADGQTLASGGDDTFVALWDLHSGQLRRLLLGSTYRINYLAFSAAVNGLSPTLATVSSDQSVGLWDAEAGRRVHLLQAYSNHIYTLDLSPDGQFLAAGGTDAHVRLWDLSTARNTSDSSVLRTPATNSAQLVQTLAEHTQWIVGVAFAPVKGIRETTGYLLASADRSGVIRLWDSATGRHVQTFHGHKDDVEALAFRPDGRRLVSVGRDLTVRLWDVARGVALATLAGHTDRLRTCAFSPDGGTLATGGHDRTVRLWSMRDDAPGRLLHILTGHTNGVRAVAFHPDGRLLASSSYDHQVILWDVASGQRCYTLPVQEVTVLSLAFHPNGNWLALGMNGDSIRIWDLAQARLHAVLQGHTSSIETLRFSPDGQWLVSGSWDETVRLWDVTTGVCLQILQAPGPYAGMKITGVTGISAAQKAALKALGAVEDD